MNNKEQKGKDSAYCRKIIKLTGNAINKHKLIEADDKILIAVSGGKDSLSLVDILAQRRKFLPINYDLHAVHVITKDVAYLADYEFMQDFCDRLDVSLHFINTHAGIEERINKKPCFTCSWNRRKELFEFAKNNNFKKIAFGHHLDDAIETLLMNMTQHGNISSIPANLSMFNGNINIIRPLLYLTNSEIERYAAIKNYVSMKQECPYEDHTMRQATRQIINQFEQLNPKARLNLFRSMSNIDTEYLSY